MSTTHRRRSIEWARRGMMALLLVLLAAAPVRSQSTGTIAGTVINAQTQAPLADINVVVAGTLFGASTGPDGSFRIEGIPPDTYTVQVSALGYRMARRSVEVAAGETVPVTFRLTPTDPQREATAVDPSDPALQPRHTLDRRGGQAFDVASGGMAVRDLPGAGSSRRGPLRFSPAVRGLGVNQLGVFIDGIRAMPGDAVRLSAPLGRLDPTMMDQVTVVAGPYALMAGSGTLGALRVDTAPFEASMDNAGQMQGRFRGNGQAAETAARLQGRALGATYRLQGVYRTGRDYTAGAGTAVPAAYTSGGAHGRVDVPLTAGASLSVRGAVQDQRDVSVPARALDVTARTSGYGTVAYRMARSTGRLRQVAASAFAAQTLQTMGHGGRPTPDAIDVRLQSDAEVATIGGRWMARLAPVRGWQVAIGGDAYHTYRAATQRRSGRPDDPPAPVPIWTDAVQQNVGLFANAARALGPVQASATARIDGFRSDADDVPTALRPPTAATAGDRAVSDWAGSGALTLAVPLTPRWTLSGGIGSVVRPPGVLARYADRVPLGGPWRRVEVLGTPGVDPERSTQGDVWLRGTFERATLRLSGFARRIDDFITLEEARVTPVRPESERVMRFVNGTATYYGAEATGDVTVNPLVTLHGRVSYQWGHDDTHNAPAPYILPVLGNLGLRIEAPFDEDVFLEAITRLAAERAPEAVAPGEAPTDGYVTLDLRLGIALSSRAALVVRIENMTDADYAYPLNAPDPLTGQPLPEPGRTAGLGLRVAF